MGMRKSYTRPISLVLLIFFAAFTIAFLWLPRETPDGKIPDVGYSRILAKLDDAIYGGQNAGTMKAPGVTAGEDASEPVKQHVPATPIMGKMANETARAALGRSAWHLLHTILARYPEAPSDLEKAKLKSFVGLFGELYPCGECAEDFLQLLTKLPVQTSSRKAAALWGCSIHNEVNKKLGKPEYDCGNVLEKYDCGCGDEPEKPKAAPK